MVGGVEPGKDTKPNPDLVRLPSAGWDTYFALALQLHVASFVAGLLGPSEGFTSFQLLVHVCKVL